MKKAGTKEGLKSLKQYGVEQRQRWSHISGSPLVPIGVACPKCGEELRKDTSKVYTSYPPLVDLICVECGYYTKVCA